MEWAAINVNFPNGDVAEYEKVQLHVDLKPFIVDATRRFKVNINDYCVAYDGKKVDLKSPKTLHEIGIVHKEVDVVISMFQVQTGGGKRKRYNTTLKSKVVKFEYTFVFFAFVFLILYFFIRSNF